MSKCKPINGLVLDKKSRDALERIRKKPIYANKLAVLLSGGVISSIFTRSNAPTAAWNISQTEWGLYSEAMAAIPKITRAVIDKEIDFMRLHYEFKKPYDYKHALFWKQMSEGCGK